MGITGYGGSTDFTNSGYSAEADVAGATPSNPGWTPSFRPKQADRSRKYCDGGAVGAYYGVTPTVTQDYDWITYGPFGGVSIQTGTLTSWTPTGARGQVLHACAGAQMVKAGRR